MRVGVDGRALRANRARAAGSPSTSSSCLPSWRACTPRTSTACSCRACERAGRAARERGGGRGRQAADERSTPRRRWPGDRGSTGCSASPDLIWAPAPAPLAVSRRTPFVLTVHDLSFVHRPRDYDLYERVWHGVAAPAPARSPRAAGAHRLGRGARGAARRVGASARAGAHREAGTRPARRALAATQHRGGLAHVLAVGGLEPRKQPALLVEAHRRRGASAVSGPASCSWATARCAASSRQTGATVLGRRPRRRARRRLRGRALPRLRLARGGLRLHPTRGARGRRAGGGVRPPGLPRDARRRAPWWSRRATPTRWPRRCFDWSASRSCASASWPPAASASSCSPGSVPRGRRGPSSRRHSGELVPRLRDRHGDPQLRGRAQRPARLGRAPARAAAAGDRGGQRVERRRRQAGARLGRRGRGPGREPRFRRRQQRRSQAGPRARDGAREPRRGAARRRARAAGRARRGARGARGAAAAEHGRLGAGQRPPHARNARGVRARAHPAPAAARSRCAAATSPGAARRPARSAGRSPPALRPRTDLLRRLGPFDPGAFLFYEDMELCLRARELGFPTILRPEIRVRHLGGTSTERALGSDALDAARTAPARGGGRPRPPRTGDRRRERGRHVRPARGRPPARGPGRRAGTSARLPRPAAKRAGRAR